MIPTAKFAVVNRMAVAQLWRNEPLILITAYPNEKHRTRALDNGAVGFLSKPFDEEELIECLTAANQLRVAQAS